MEVTEVRRDTLRGLGILSEAFREPLRDRSGCTNVFRLGKESGCPDSVAFLKRFIREVGFWVRRLLRLGFVFLVGILYEGWEGASPAGVYPFGVLPSCISFRLAVGLTADTAARKASGHLYGSGAEVDLRVVLVQPGEPEYHALFTEAGDCKQNPLGMSFVGSTFLCPTSSDRNRPVPIGSTRIPSWTLISERIPSGSDRNLHIL